MKLYDFKMAPNARRVRVFAAEKGIDLLKEEVDLGKKAQLRPEFLAKNPFGAVPALELDDGTIITESTAICRYLEDVFPDPPLMGSNPIEKAQVMMWDRRVEQHGFDAVAEGFRNGNPFFADRSLTGTVDFPQLDVLAKRGPVRFANFLKMLDNHLANSEFIAGDRYSIADITALISCDFAKTIKMGPPFASHPNVQRWYDAVSARDSARQ